MVSPALQPKLVIEPEGTPQEIYEALDDLFHFTLDVAASRLNSKCPEYFDAESDGLKSSWGVHRVFCNPPGDGDTALWVGKAIYETEVKDCQLAVLLLPLAGDYNHMIDLHAARVMQVPAASMCCFDEDGDPEPMQIVVFAKLDAIP